ncbi:unnamed protein product [Durusdinium trenchii]|uniref:Uncharacterized protein n=1 Tax=Durusdinium trenchii TaxID=1381693 RepID=A0ABP0KN88_9DINO
MEHWLAARNTAQRLGQCSNQLRLRLRQALFRRVLWKILDYYLLVPQGIRLSFGPTILIREDNMALLAYHDFRVQGDQMLFTRLALLTTMLTSTKVSDGVSKLIVKSDFDKMTRSLHKQTVQMEAILKEAWKQDDTDVGPQKKAMAFGKLSVRMCLLLFGKQKFGRDPLVETFEEITQLYAEELVGDGNHGAIVNALSQQSNALTALDQDAVCSIFENYSASASEFCDFDFVLARGRRFPQLVARLGEISDYVTKLGAAGPYSHFYHGHEVPLNNSVLPQLQPYMPLDANRLSIKGHGCFDATPHLGDELLMAYRMPDLLLCDRQPQYGDFPIMTDDATQIIQLAKMWDARGLLFLRRGPVEAAANAVGPPVTAADVADLHAYSEMLSREANEKKVKRTREVEGDQLHLLHEPSDKKRASLLSDEIFICFKSLFQGDHGGVEFATASHESVLQSQGLLSSSTRLVANRPFRGGPLADGLVIDDYFAISREPRRLAPEQSAAARYFSQSQAVYKKYDLIGSPQKDVIGEKRARVIGAEINSNDHAARRGITSVGSPIGKRLSLSWVTFQIAQLPATTDSLHLCLLGGWTSMILYRRPFMSLLTAVHKLVDAASVDADAPKTVALPRSVANELCLMSVLAPLMVSDIAADFSEEIFATDPSNTKGAIVSTTTLPSVAQELWRCCRTKGAYSRLKTDYELLVERLGIAEDVGEDVNALKPRVSDGIAELVLQAADNPFTEEGVTQMTDYEEALQDMMENGGFANPAVSQICAGLITLYDAKAATTEDAQYYDRATEYISMMQQAMQAAMGDAALTDPTFFYLESRKQKLRRKKDRRLAKGAPSQELQTLMKQR